MNPTGEPLHDNVGARESGIQFLENHLELSSFTHLAASKALSRELDTARSPRLRKVLIARLFAEYAAAFETLAVLSLATRSRWEKDFLTYFLTYEPGITRSFYEEIEKLGPNFDFRSYMRLPTLNSIESVVHNDELTNGYRQNLVSLTGRFQEIARLVGTSDYITIHIFNKVKHACCYVDDVAIFEKHFGVTTGAWSKYHRDDDVWVPPHASRVRVLPPSTLNTSREFGKMLRLNVKVLTGTERALTSTLIFLAEYGVLYEEDMLVESPPPSDSKSRQ